jgi:hypothetical protein
LRRETTRRYPFHSFRTTLAIIRLAKAAKEALVSHNLTVMADKDYFSATEVLACHEKVITVNVSPPGDVRQPCQGQVREGRLRLRRQA